MKSYYISIVLFFISLCGIAQTVDTIRNIQEFDKFEKYTHLAKDSLAIQNIVAHQKFCYSSRHFTIEKGEKGEAEATHRLLMWSLSSVLSQNKIFGSQPTSGLLPDKSLCIYQYRTLFRSHYRLVRIIFVLISQ